VLVSYFHFIIKRCRFSDCHRPSHRVSFGVHCFKSLNMSSYANLYPSNLCHLKRFFAIPRDARNSWNSPFCSFIT
jgi:hypothetical protein